MLIRQHKNMTGQDMTPAGAEKVAMRLLLGREDGAPTFAMRHFTVEPGGHSPRHQHNYEHGVYVVGGKGTVEINGENRPITAGDALFVPPNVLHEFRADQNSELQFLCMVPTHFDCGKPTPGA